MARGPRCQVAPVTSPHCQRSEVSPAQPFPRVPPFRGLRQPSAAWTRRTARAGSASGLRMISGRDSISSS